MYTAYIFFETQMKQKGSAGIIIILVVIALLFIVIIYNSIALIYDYKTKDKDTKSYEE